ncbi:MAG: rRNA adenine N-6-methyltransferase family protein, partial [Pseudomonadota bacterium]
MTSTRLDPSPLKPVSSPDELPPLRTVIETLELNAKKSLGQNFILDLNLTQRIARLGGPLDGHTIIEIGPGPGGLTRGLLLQGASRVIAVERDGRVRPAIGQLQTAWPGQISPLFEDALSVDWPTAISTLDVT